MFSPYQVMHRNTDETTGKGKQNSSKPVDEVEMMTAKSAKRCNALCVRFFKLIIVTAAHYMYRVNNASLLSQCNMVLPATTWERFCYRASLSVSVGRCVDTVRVRACVCDRQTDRQSQQHKTQKTDGFR